MKSNISKEPKDAKIPQDNKRKNINITNKKVPKKHSDNLITNNLLNNEISNNKSKENNKYFDTLKQGNQKKVNHISNGNERSLSDADQLNLTMNYKKSKNYIKFNENKNISQSNIKNNNKKNIIVSNKGKELNNLIETNQKNTNNKKKELNKSNINNTHNNVNRKFIKSKTQEFKSTKKIINNEFEDKNDDFFNLNDNCLIY